VAGNLLLIGQNVRKSKLGKATDRARLCVEGCVKAEVDIAFLHTVAISKNQFSLQFGP
jgi:hypothetical protein